MFFNFSFKNKILRFKFQFELTNELSFLRNSLYKIAPSLPILI